MHGSLDVLVQFEHDVNFVVLQLNYVLLVAFVTCGATMGLQLFR